MSAVRTARDRARRELTEEILAAGRAQVAASGATSLSLRAVARELGMASSAVYRYFATRDELLTALIVEAYDALGEEVERAAEPRAGASRRDRWLAAARAVRGWALTHPHQYGLLYGSPVPGFHAAPERTNGPGSRVPLALLGIFAGAPEPRTPIAAPPPPLSPVLTDQARWVGALVSPAVPEDRVVRGAMAWTSVFGLVSFEVFGQLRGSFAPAEELFEHAIGRLADALDAP
jgi:AcrR family transcriptional regulator